MSDYWSESSTIPEVSKHGTTVGVDLHTPLSIDPRDVVSIGPHLRKYFVRSPQPTSHLLYAGDVPIYLFLVRVNTLDRRCWRT